jgi:endonuclease/exonuclease/phosphatase (EEP) superfamily protein YafD
VRRHSTQRFPASAATRLLLAGLAVLGVASALALAAPIGWPWELFVHFRVQYAAGALAVAAGLALCRHPRACLVAIALAALNALPMLQRAQAGSSPGACAGRAFTVVSANLQAGNDDRRFLDWLAEHPADLVVVQEVTPAWAHDLARLADYPHRVLLTREDPYGIGVLSRWPLDAVQQEDLAADGLPSLAGRVRFEGRSLRWLALHTHWPITPALARARDRSLDAAAALVRGSEGPIVVLGDLNATPYAPAYADFLRNSGLRDAAAATRWQPSWMAGFWPLALRIDYVFASPGLCVESSGVGSAIGSDHRPVFAKVRFAAD